MKKEAVTKALQMAGILSFKSNRPVENLSFSTGLISACIAVMLLPVVMKRR